MSEKQTSPEQQPKPLYDNCSNCEQDYQLTPDNSTLYLHKVNPDCDHLEMNCPNCGYKTALFGLTEPTLQRAIDLGIEPIYERYPDDNILALRLGYLGIELVQSMEISPRHEQLISQFEQVIESTPDEHLYDLIADDGYNQPHPRRWA